MNNQCFPKIWLAAVLTLLAAGFVRPAWGQSPVLGDVFSSNNPFYGLGLDPLAGQGEIMPPATNGCVPPDRTWKLVAQKNGQCDYFAPFKQRLNGRVANSINEAGTLEQNGWRCGSDEFDPSKAVCSPPSGGYLPSNNGGGVATNRGGQAPGGLPGLIGAIGSIFGGGSRSKPQTNPGNSSGQAWWDPMPPAYAEGGTRPVGSTWSCRACEPRVCFKQSAEFTECIAQAQEPPKPPLQGSVTEYGNPAEPGPGPIVDPGGGPPREPGVDWDTWYKNWINQVQTDVWNPLDSNFANDQNQYTVKVTYTLSPGGGAVRFAYSWSSFPTKSANYATSVVNLMRSIQSPPFPKGSKLKSLSRTFTFSHNMGNSGIRLGGAPKG